MLPKCRSRTFPALKNQLMNLGLFFFWISRWNMKLEEIADMIIFEADFWTDQKLDYCQNAYPRTCRGYYIFHDDITTSVKPNYAQSISDFHAHIIFLKRRGR